MAKQLELLNELVPRADAIAFIVNQKNAVAMLDTSDAQTAAAALGKKLVVVEAATKVELERVFTTMVEQHGQAVAVQADPFFLGEREQIVVLRFAAVSRLKRSARRAPIFFRICRAG